MKPVPSRGLIKYLLVHPTTFAPGEVTQMRSLLKSVALGVAVVATCVFSSSAKADLTVEPTFGTAGWLSFMNVFETPANGGGFVFGSGWGVDYFTASPNDIGGFNPASIEMRSSTIDDPDPFWFSSGAPGSGAVGNKLMEANLFQEFAEGSTGSLAGMNLTFDFNIAQFDFDSDVTVRAFIKEFNPLFAGVLNETFVDITGTGSYSITQAIDGTQGAVQYGFVTENIVLWTDDAYTNGRMVIGVPEPTSVALLGLTAIGMVVRRRR